MKTAILATVLSLMLIASCISSSAQTKKTFSNIQNMTAWTSCDVCSGSGGNGNTAVHWQAQFQSTPSMSGSSSQFYFGGVQAYTSALWWEQLGSNPQYSHFNYDLQFYVTDITAPQALEFDVNQSLNGKKYVFGTECDLRGTYKGYWRVWDATLHWQNTGIACTGITANAWHHLVWEFERTTDGHTHFIAVTVDGVRRVVNRYYNPLNSTAKELNVAFQTDGNKYPNTYSVWLDKVSLIAW
ncbi:hypothetical protein Acid345_1199 [Candidatus Koribacter versatilis Ellin345]|uniref:Uncharacterized protein n=1 Tax=Koribacter versatilis (strain Ellin345) TaxID=204669 RepID=Q1ISE8_KORVE|nr:hypothetical protein [Candidatus Koribacter versatilis]ABF40202.1 hypothetical protein Acid345_1199 [Candidatus Koribacter versatilis Ellin345]